MSRTPLVVLGYDVGDAGLIERFAGEGRMPVAARILDRGVRARTTGHEYMTEHGIWVPLATGLSRTRTGYYYFRQLVPGSYELRSTTARDFEGTPWWSELAGGGRRGAVTDVPDAPLVAGLDGVQLLDFATHQPRMTAHGPSAHPSSLLAEARRVYEILEAAGGEPNVFLLTTMGMTSQHPTPDLADGFCHLLGYQVAPRGESASVGLAGRLADLVPERLCSAISARLPQSGEERRLSERFRAGTDWSRTVAFAIPGLHAGFIRVNLAGREPAGTVDTGAGYRELVAEIEAELLRLVDPVAGGPAVRRVYRTADLSGGAPPEQLPDLVVEWQPAPYFLERLIHARGEIRQALPRYCPDSYHSLEGLFAAAGPSVAPRGDLGAIDVLDAAPTCLGLLGVPAPAVMGGRDVLAASRLAPPGASS